MAANVLSFVTSPIAAASLCRALLAVRGEYERAFVAHAEGDSAVRGVLLAFGKSLALEPVALAGVRPINPVAAAHRAAGRRLRKGDVAVFLDEWCAWIAPGAIDALVGYLGARDADAVHPCVVGSDRALYLHQTMGRVPSWLLADWSPRYIDAGCLGAEAPALAEAVHRAFLASLAADPSGAGWRFGEYDTTVAERSTGPIEYKVAAAPEAQLRRERMPFQAVAWRVGRDAWLRAATSARDLASHGPRSPIFGGALMASVANHRQHLVDVGVLQAYGRQAERATRVDEPLRLVPAAPTQVKETELTYLVSTCASNEDSEARTVVRLLTAGCGISPKRVLVVSGAHERASQGTFEGVRIERVTPNSYDHGALIEAAREGVAGHAFLLHDTTRPGPRFHQLVMDRPCERGHVAMLQHGWFNMGLFSADYLLAHGNYVRALEGLSKFQAVLSEQVFPRFASGAFYQPFAGMRVEGRREIGGRSKLVTYHPALDLYKHQTYHVHAPCTTELFARYRTDPRDALTRMDLR